MTPDELMAEACRLAKELRPDLGVEPNRAWTQKPNRHPY